MTARTHQVSALDLIGLFIAATAALWVVWSAGATGGSAGPMVGLLIGAPAVAFVARTIARSNRWIVPAILAGVVLALVVLRFPDYFPAKALSGPVGYQNADAALYLQATVAGLMVFAWVWQRYGSFRPVTVAGIVGAVVLAGIAIATNSRAVDVLLLLPVGALVAVKPRHARIVIVVFAAIVAAALAITIVLGATQMSTRPSTGVVYQELSSRRPALWHDALTLMWQHPIFGVGPARFQVTSPIARSDRDARWAHNGFLQQGAETGIPGFVLLVALFGWGFLWLWSTPSPDRITALAAAALAALGVQACIDYVLHFPVLPLFAAALVGVGAAGRTRAAGRQRDGQRERGFART